METLSVNGVSQAVAVPVKKIKTYDSPRFVPMMTFYSALAERKYDRPKDETIARLMQYCRATRAEASQAVEYAHAIPA